ncbi:MAG: selenide, water dikinase SelD [Saprospiraceae bacterium]
MTLFPLTQFSHGAGCGCKISPKTLSAILHHVEKTSFPGLLVGNEERDDAAVMDLGDGTAIISTTDFFMPIVDDPGDFGQIASVNAISDIYAMGGEPLMAIAILGWPINTIPADIAGQVVEGGRKACSEAGIPLAGGHSIDSPEPIFGLAVTGRVPIAHLKKNGGATSGCRLFLTKPLGVGILTTAQKKGLVDPAHLELAKQSMLQLNKPGSVFGKLSYVKAMTDVTGFGLLGHLLEMCQASQTRAVLDFSKVPTFDRDMLLHYLDQKCIPGGTHRNWESYGECIGPMGENQRYILTDPQTSGGLLVAVEEEHIAEFQAEARKLGLELESFGVMEGYGGGEFILSL